MTLMKKRASSLDIPMVPPQSFVFLRTNTANPPALPRTIRVLS